MRRALLSSLVLGAGFCGLVAVSGRALAQTVPTQFLQTSPLPHIEPQETPSLGAGLPNFQPLTAEGALPSLTIPVGTVTIIGATAFPQRRLNEIIAGLAGQRVKLSQIEAVRLALVGLYRRHGYVLTTVSMDIDAQGDVRFIVTEGYISSVKLSADVGPAGTMVLAFLQNVTNERPISEASLERWLLLAQQVPGISVHAVLQADADNPGALTLIAEVSRQDVSALVTADDRGYVDTGPAEGLAVIDLNSVTSFGDQTEVSMFHTSGGTNNFGQIDESFFIGSTGLRLKVYGGAGRALPGGTLGKTKYESNLEVFGGQLSYPLLLRRDQALNLSLSFDALGNLIITDGFRTSSDNLRVGRFGAQYAWQDLWIGDSREGVNVLNLRESQGIPLLGTSPDGRMLGEAGRSGEKTDFWKLNGSIARTQTLGSPLPDATLALHLEAGGQYTTDILPSAEEFDLGGNHFTRGFYSGEVSGDKALYATAELQLNTGASFNLFQLPVDFGAQFYTFYDWGETWSNLSSDLNYKVASAGAGVRLGITKSVELDGEFVHRLTTQLDRANPSNPLLSGNVIYWGATARY
jgi:hemolysin activation/secretion protein